MLWRDPRQHCFGAAQKDDIDAGVDIAKGRNDWSIRLPIDEAF